MGAETGAGVSPEVAPPSARGGDAPLPHPAMKTASISAQAHICIFLPTTRPPLNFRSKPVEDVDLAPTSHSIGTLSGSQYECVTYYKECMVYPFGTVGRRPEAKEGERVGDRERPKGQEGPKGA